VGKSTYARCGIIVNVTRFEPEWEGFVTLEISNPTPLPARIYANEGLCQILFLPSDEVRETIRRAQGQIPVAERDCAAAVVGSREGNWFESAAEENLEGLAIAIRFEASRYHD
jgi:hypothetical protein